MTARHPRVFADAAAAVAALAEDFAAHVRAGDGRVTVALAGGRTPAAFYRRLAAHYRDRLPWARIEIFFGDERFVPPDHPASNYRLVRETLLDHVPVPAANVHPMPTIGLTPAAAARRYETELLACFAGPPRLDWVLLGVGGDGHTASLFPGFEPPPEAWVAPILHAPKPPPTRLTLTYRSFNRARRVRFLVTGAAKAAVVARIFGQPALGLPAQRIAPLGECQWYLDRAAASALPALAAGQKKGRPGLPAGGGSGRFSD